MTDQEPRVCGVAFWLVSAVRGTGVLLVGAILALACVFSITSIRSDGFSAGAIFASVPPAILWSLIGLVATCYVTVPAAALVTGIVRIAYRRIKRGSVTYTNR